MHTALITGSFDPITVGHMQLVETASRLFDEVYLLICANTEKMSGAFHPEDRAAIARKAVEKYANVNVAVCGGLVSDFAKQVGAKYLVRGLRSGVDFDYEYDLAGIMKRFDSSLETIFLPADPNLACVSATYVRDLLKYGCTLEGSVPAGCEEMILELYRKNHE
ncbi:MAG: pantetheine-phosphate adenylyltransferase [Ruminococcaceae bacterium]|nr:pantetheine-phosphate adenylyltransferase [Oscillospiraceae bacterium]